jgi:hypothetical protein
MRLDEDSQVYFNFINSLHSKSRESYRFSTEIFELLKTRANILTDPPISAYTDNTF